MAEHGVDRRVARTRRSIMGAFERLVTEHGVKGLTVSAIAKEADIDRKTFYTHFGSIDGLLDAVANDLVVEILDEVDAALATKAARDGKSDEPFSVALREFFAAINRSTCANFQMNQSLIRAIEPDKLVERLRIPLERETKRRRYLSHAVSNVSPKVLGSVITFELSGILAVYRSVLLDDDADKGGQSDAAKSIQAVSDLASTLVERGLLGLEGVA